MNINNIVLNIYGNITFNDQSSAPIEVTLAYNDSISSPYSNLANYATLHRDSVSILNNFFGTLSPHLVALSPNATPATKTVTDVTLTMDVGVTYDNNSEDSFFIEYLNGVVTSSGNAVDVWTDMVNFNKPLLVSVFEKLSGVGAAALVLYLFSECFGACAGGSVSNASPGPICGWTFNSAFGPGAASVVLNGSAKMTSTSATAYLGITKALPDQLIDVDNLSGRFDFSEYSTAPNAETTYQLFINNYNLTKTAVVTFFGDGNAVLQFGNIGGAAFYAATWVPNNGIHEVHFVTGSSPALYLDGNSLPLTPFGNVATFSGSLPANIVGLFGGSGRVGTTTSETTYIFVTTGSIGSQSLLDCQ